MVMRSVPTFTRTALAPDMSSPLHSTSLTPDERRAALDRLAAAAQALEMAAADLDQRMALARTASTAAELDAVLADVPVVGRASIANGVVPALVEPPFVQPPPLAEARMAVLFEHAKREGRWTMPRVLRVVVVCGHVELDLSDAVLLPGTSRIVLSAWLSNVEITVPAWIRLESDGTVDITRRDGEPPSAAPLAVVTLTGQANASKVEVKPSAARITPQ